eukprot:scaffold437986_cov42-Prasinocladus_malaysianus.AAC.1
MGGPDNFSAQHSRQYVRPGASIASAPSLPKPGQDEDGFSLDAMMGSDGMAPPYGAPGDTPQAPPGAPPPPGAHLKQPAPPLGAPPAGTPANQGSKLSGPSLTALRATPKEQAEFPNNAGPEDPIKLPGQTRVSPEEYKVYIWGNL